MTLEEYDTVRGVLNGEGDKNLKITVLILTKHIQAVVSDPLLVAQCRVERLTAQRRSVILPLDRYADGAGHADRLAVVLLGNHTCRKMKKQKVGEEESRSE